MNRRGFTAFLFLLISKSTLAGSLKSILKKNKKKMIKNKHPIDFQWPVKDPFLFCVHHYDHYPAGNADFGINAKELAGRNIGQDFDIKDGFRMYHGKTVPGFPVHPHRGFETITIVRKGYVDHADSLGAAGRYGQGDVQWMTAGSGVQHSEMFPLLHQDKENTLELFQIWINLPAKSKMVAPDFKMLWSNQIPHKKDNDKLKVTIINGCYEDTKFYQAPTNSWAAKQENDVNILLVKMKKSAIFKFPKSGIEKNRMVYFFTNSDYQINNEDISGKMAIEIDCKTNLEVTALSDLEFLLLDSVPIKEPVFQHGPFVMNTKQEIIQTFDDYNKTQFGGWSWKRKDMIHGKKIEKFAKYPNGKIEKPNV